MVALINKPRRSLKKVERLQYIASVQCLLEKPAITPSAIAPGAISRYDDFVATHINQTMSIHFVVSAQQRRAIQ
jgi:tyrosinase